MDGALAATRARVAMIVPAHVTIARGVVDMRAEPRTDAELVDQVHFREIAVLLARRAGWAYVQAEDHYFGWIPEAAAAAGTFAAGDLRIVAVPLAEVRERPDPAAAVVDRLAAGTWLPAHTRLDRRGWAWLPGGWIELDATVARSELPHRPPTAEDLIRTAEAFLDVPYLWGGTTALGIDCSGFVQQVYRLNGIRLDRDADQQATEGRGVEVPRAGDLVFFSPSPGGAGAERVTHVALATGERTFLHAPRAGARVERGELPAGGRTVRAIRRYLPPAEDGAR